MAEASVKHMQTKRVSNVGTLPTGSKTPNPDKNTNQLVGVNAAKRSFSNMDK